MKRLMYLQLVVFIALLPFQDSGLQGSPLRFMAASLSTFPLVLILGTYCLIAILSGNIRIKYVCLGILFYVVAINLAYIGFGPAESHGEQVAVRAFKLAIVNALFILPIFVIKYEEFNLDGALRIAFIIACAGLLFSSIFAGLDSNTFLHFHENGNMRPRGFSLEASTLSVCLVTLGLLVARGATSHLGKIVAICMIALTLVLSGSKGGLIAFVVSGTFAVLLKQNLSFLKKTALTLVAAFVCLGTLELTASWFRTDISDYTSLASRVVLVATSVDTSMHRPFGVGYSGFLPAIDHFGPEATQFISTSASVPLNFTEVETYFGSRSAENISSKTFFFDNLMYFGIPFVLCFLMFNYRLIQCLRRENELWLLFAVLFVVIALSTYCGGLEQYNVSLVYGVAFAVYRQKHSSCFA